MGFSDLKKVKRILIVGLGSMGKKYLDIVTNNFPAVKIGVISNRTSSELSEEYATIDFFFNNISDALEFQPDGVIVCNPASSHVDSALPFIESGSSILIEKPISNDINKAKNIVKLCREKNIISMMGYNLRYLPSLIEFKRNIDSGLIGDIYSVKGEVGSFLPNWRKGFDYRDSVSAQKSSGGGVLNELSHEIDYIQWIFGKVTWVSSILSKQSDLEIDVEDSCNMILGLQRENQKNEVLASLNLDFIRQDPVRTCNVIGSKGSLFWNGLKGAVHFFPAGGNSWQILHNTEEDIFSTYVNEVKDFINCMNSNVQPSSDCAQGLIVLEIIEAARESSKKFKVIRL